MLVIEVVLSDHTLSLYNCNNVNTITTDVITMDEVNARLAAACALVTKLNIVEA